MPQIQATGGSAPVTLDADINVNVKGSFTTTGAVVGTTETSIVLPIGVKAFRLHTAKGSNAVLTVASSSTGTGSAITSWDLGMGVVWVEEGLTGEAALTIYIKSNKAATDVQVLHWT